MDCLIKPSFVTRPYNPAHCVAIRDRWQQFLYIKHGARPLDIYVDQRENLVMLFDKDETQDLYDKYRKYELK